MYLRRSAPVSAPRTKSFRREPGATGQNSRQPEGLQPESALAALLVLAIERLLPSPGALPSPILAATHTCFIMLGSLYKIDQRLAGHFRRLRQAHHLWQGRRAGLQGASRRGPGLGAGG